jgi:FtsZ-interacting cell division protein ZipA
MSELQLALIVLGALLVAGVWGYNFWQERQYRRRAAQVLPADRTAPDVLMAGRAEAEARVEPEVSNSAVLREPTFGSGAEEVPDEPVAAEPPAEWADGRADCLLRVEFVSAEPAAALRSECHDWAVLIDKPLQWLGLDAHSGRWRALLPQDPGTITQLAVALQLTDRRGPVAAETLARFVEGVHALAQRHAGLVELPDRQAVLDRAGALDAFCAAVDLQLSLHVVPRPDGPTEMAGARLKPVLDAAGLRLEGERFVAFAGDGAEMFALGCQVTTEFAPSRIETLALTGLNFSLDVPRVAAGTVAYDRMLECARAAVGALDGQLVDPHGKPLPDATLDAIRARIDELQQKMSAHALPAGSLRALRLFS